MADIILTTLNARYAHCAFGLRYLLANLGPLKGRAAILEFDISQRTLDVAEAILREQPRIPRIVGLGVYIWNAAESLRLVADLKRLRPGLIVVLGGPEVSYETEQQEIVKLADYVIAGEGDVEFARLCGELLGEGTSPAGGGHCQLPIANCQFQDAHPSSLPGGRPPDFARPTRESGEEDPHLSATELGPISSPKGRGVGATIIPAVPPVFSSAPGASPGGNNPGVALPYDLYSDDDLAHRVVYVEASRGCPFECEFCLSSLEVPVRQVPLEPFLAAMQRLLDRGLNQFKFVDRTFNLNITISTAILRFFLERYRPGLFLHFEMIPDRLPAGPPDSPDSPDLRDLIARFPPGALQLEVGVQTFNPAAAARISRKQDNAKVEENLRFLRRETGVHIHADLIVGLPGEDLPSFAAGFDRLVALAPQEIQVGILKRLRGTPIIRHDAEWGMIYSPNPPYELLENRLLDFATMQRLRRFARYWDLVANSGNFTRATPLIWGAGKIRKSGNQEITKLTPGAHPGLSPRSPDSSGAFAGFLRLTDWLYARAGRTHGIALPRLAGLLFEYLTTEGGVDRAAAAEAILDDYRRTGRSDVPGFLRDGEKRLGTGGAGESGGPPAILKPVAPPRRQSRHLA